MIFSPWGMLTSANSTRISDMDQKTSKSEFYCARDFVSDDCTSVLTEDRDSFFVWSSGDTHGMYEPGRRKRDGYISDKMFSIHPVFSVSWECYWNSLGWNGHFIWYLIWTNATEWSPFTKNVFTLFPLQVVQAMPFLFQKRFRDDTKRRVMDPYEQLQSVHLKMCFQFL